MSQDDELSSQEMSLERMQAAFGPVVTAKERPAGTEPVHMSSDALAEALIAFKKKGLDIDAVAVASKLLDLQEFASNHSPKEPLMSCLTACALRAVLQFVSKALKPKEGRNGLKTSKPREV